MKWFCLFVLAMISLVVASDTAEACSRRCGGGFFSRERVVVRERCGLFNRGMGCGLFNRGCSQQQCDSSVIVVPAPIVPAPAALKDGQENTPAPKCVMPQCVMPPEKTPAPGVSIVDPNQNFVVGFSIISK